MPIRTCFAPRPRYDGTCRNRTEPPPGISPVVCFRNRTSIDATIEILGRETALNRIARALAYIGKRS